MSATNVSIPPAAPQSGAGDYPAAGTRMSSRWLLRDATAITLVPGRSDSERLDILVQDGKIVELGEDLVDNDPSTVEVALDGRIVSPGFINAHLHTWQTSLRSVGADWTLMGYLAQLHGVTAGRCEPHHMYAGTWAGALSQLASGTTTIGDWCHNCQSAEHADSALEGLKRAGARAVFLHGTPYRDPARPHPIAEVDRLREALGDKHPLLTVGMAIQGPTLSAPAVVTADLEAARERGITASFHQSVGEPTPVWDELHQQGLFGPGVNIAHGMGLPDEWLRKLLDVGVTFTSTPENELGQGHGHPIVPRLRSMGSAPSLGTDTEAVSPGHMPASARVAAALARAAVHGAHFAETGGISADPPVTSREILEWMTVRGAEALGLGDQVGTLAPGMAADLVVIDPRTVDLWPAHDPIATVLGCAPSHVEAVMVAGTWRKRDHKLIGVTTGEVLDLLSSAADALLPTDS